MNDNTFGVNFLVPVTEPRFFSSPFRPTTVCDTKTKDVQLLGGNNIFYKQEGTTWIPQNQ